jgi:hypothetical protein
LLPRTAWSTCCRDIFHANRRACAAIWFELARWWELGSFFSRSARSASAALHVTFIQEQVVNRLTPQEFITGWPSVNSPGPILMPRICRFNSRRGGAAIAASAISAVS